MKPAELIAKLTRLLELAEAALGVVIEVADDARSTRPQVEHAAQAYVGACAAVEKGMRRLLDEIARMECALLTMTRGSHGRREVVDGLRVLLRAKERLVHRSDRVRERGQQARDSLAARLDAERAHAGAE